jgi:glycosyltransferase involved in cell wall biosynthesis
VSSDTLSVIIPARNEQFLQKTIESVLSAAVEPIEVIAVLDGYWPEQEYVVKDHPSVNVLHFSSPIGQRAAINRGCKVATGKYMMKLDAHCNVAKGFDKILKEDCKYEWTMVPRMYNLDVETWLPKKHKRTDYMYISSPDFEKPLRAMYYGNYGGIKTAKPSVPKDVVIDETMCCMGPGWFMHMDRFWELGGCDEGHGGWGQQGVEVSLKAWLSGGALMVNKKTWFAHFFRGGGVPDGFKSGFPYKISGKDVDKARKYSQDLWLNNKWEKQTRPISWLVEKFDPPTWNGTGSTIMTNKYKRDLSVVIPSFRDPHLHKTVIDIIRNFRTDYEIIVIIDGYKLKTDLPKSDRINVLYHDKNKGMRESINTGVAAAEGKYLMRTDEHCMFCEGFDEIILSSIQDNWIVDARRYFLDPHKWERMERAPIDYEKLIIKQMPLNCKKLASVEWPSRTKERADVMLDENMCFQGSVWVMAHEWWKKVIGRLQTEGYGPLYQDTIEMLFKTWNAGGKLMLNKKAWYAHRHREFGRTHRYTYKRATPDWHYALLKHWDDYLKIKERWGV